MPWTYTFHRQAMRNRTTTILKPIASHTRFHGETIKMLWLKRSCYDLKRSQRFHAKTRPLQWLKTKCYDLTLPLVHHVAQGQLRLTTRTGNIIAERYQMAPVCCREAQPRRATRTSSSSHLSWGRGKGDHQHPGSGLERTQCPNPRWPPYRSHRKWFAFVGGVPDRSRHHHRLPSHPGGPAQTTPWQICRGGIARRSPQQGAGLPRAHPWRPLSPRRLGDRNRRPVERGNLHLPPPLGPTTGTTSHPIAPASSRGSFASPLVRHAHTCGFHGLCGIPPGRGLRSTSKHRRRPPASGPAPRPQRPHRPTPTQPPPPHLANPLAFANPGTGRYTNCQQAWGQASIKTVNTAGDRPG